METSTTQHEIIEQPQSAEQQLAGCWESAAMEPHYPVTTRDVVKLLRSGGGYDATVDLLDSWGRSRTVTPQVNSNGFLWSAEDILLAASLLNSSRRWLLNSQHVAKMSGVELAELQARQVGKTIFDELDAVDYRTLLGTIASERLDSETRLVLCRALQSKLEIAGLI